MRNVPVLHEFPRPHRLWPFRMMSVQPVVQRLERTAPVQPTLPGHLRPCCTDLRHEGSHCCGRRGRHRGEHRGGHDTDVSVLPPTLPTLPTTLTTLPPTLTTLTTLPILFFLPFFPTLSAPRPPLAPYHPLLLHHGRVFVEVAWAGGASLFPLDRVERAGVVKYGARFRLHDVPERFNEVQYEGVTVLRCYCVRSQVSASYTR